MKKSHSTTKVTATEGSVFVVDDNALLVEFASTVLEAAGYDVQHFLNAKAALRAMREASPKVLVTDYEMGEINGLELIQSSHKLHPGLRTLLVSGTVDSSITATHAAKVDRFLGKPYNPADLQKAVAELMKL